MSNSSLIQSPSGKRMFAYISPVYYSSRVMQTIFERIGLEFDDIHSLLPDIQNQLFPQTATWGLRYWEELVGLPVDEGEAYQDRRSKVVAKIQKRWPVSVKNMERIISNASGDVAVRIVQNISYCTDRYEFVSPGTPLNLVEVAKIIDEAKPAHRAYELCVGNDRQVQIHLDYRKNLFAYNLCGITLCGTYPALATPGRLVGININIDTSYSAHKFYYPPCGTLLSGTYP